VIPRAQERQCDTIQIFSRNPRRWNYSPLDPEHVKAFRTALCSSNIAPVFVHMPYIVNCASAQAILYKRSIDSLCAELLRSAQIGAHYVIIHAGSSENKADGIDRMTHALNKALNKVQNEIVLLIENTPGSGNEFGDAFEHIEKMIADSDCPDRIGMVLDTAHASAAGYDLHTKSGVNKTLEYLDNKVQMNNVHLVHLNDSRTAAGSRYDRHEHIGKGSLGIGLKHVVNHPLLRSKPFIMETPRMNVKDDLRNLKTVLKYRKAYI